LMGWLPYAGVLSVLAAGKGRSQARKFAVTNALVQIGVFVPLAHLPCYLTGVMSWVDLAWPTGLVALGLQTLFFSLPSQKVGGGKALTPMAPKLAGVCYLFQGLRMAAGAALMAKAGHFKEDLTRYKYQYEQRWAKRGIRPGTARFKLAQQKDIFAQALANMGTLAVPAALTLSSPSTGSVAVRGNDVAALLLWGLSYWFEHASDMQKQRWLRKRRRARGEEAARLGAFCQEGHWRYCRHPNYLGEWGVWCALTLLALPALAQHLGTTHGQSASQPSAPSSAGLEAAADWARKAVLAGGLASVPLTMYLCLTWWTGAVPAEFYSKQKRKGYAEYMDTVPMFFPQLVSFKGGSKHK